MYYSENTVVFMDGAYLKAFAARPSLFSQSLQYGCGVFDGIRAYDTPVGVRLFKAEEHFERLAYSAEKMHLDFPYRTHELVTYTYQVLERNGLSNAYVRPMIFSTENLDLTATPHTHVYISAWEWKPIPKSEGLKVMVSSYTRPDPSSCHIEAKISGHYVNSVLAKTEARRKGYDEAILLDAQGYVASTAAANLFIEKNDVLYTAPKGNIMPGITRSTIIELADSLGIPVREVLFTPDMILEADSVFLTGTSVEVSWVSQVENHHFSLDWEDSLGFVLAKKYQQLVSQSDGYTCTLI